MPEKNNEKRKAIFVYVNSKIYSDWTTFRNKKGIEQGPLVSMALSEFMIRHKFDEIKLEGKING